MGQGDHTLLIEPKQVSLHFIYPKFTLHDNSDYSVRTVSALYLSLIVLHSQEPANRLEPPAANS